MTLVDTLRAAAQRIDARDAELLLRTLLGRDRAWMLAHPEAEIAPEIEQSFEEQVRKRARHWPLQYLTGRQAFFGLNLEVTPDVLIPRPETELLVEAVLRWVAASPLAPASLRLADVGTGSGAIALALVSQLPGATALALDLSPAVQAVVERNAAKLHLADQIEFRISDLLAALGPEIDAGRRLDVIVSNPPYVPLADAPTLAPEVHDFEPHTALFAGENGLGIYRRLIPQAWQALTGGGLLAMEFGFGQQPAIERLLEGWQKVQFLDDYAGIARVVLAERPGRLDGAAPQV